MVEISTSLKNVHLSYALHHNKRAHTHSGTGMTTILCDNQQNKDPEELLEQPMGIAKHRSGSYFTFLTPKL